MGMVHSITTASATGGDRILATLIAGLEIEFGRGAGTALAERFLDAEEGDFLWAARSQERWLGSYEAVDEEGLELDRIAICGQLDGRWFASVVLVDGNGAAQGILGRWFCRSRKSAQDAMMNAH